MLTQIVGGAQDTGDAAVSPARGTFDIDTLSTG